VGARAARNNLGQWFQPSDPEAARGPSDVVADVVAFAQHVDTGEVAAQWSADYLNVRKLEADFAPTLRTNGTPAAVAVEPHEDSLVEITREALAVEIVTHSK
jgi:hypothetical protein